MQGPFSCRLTHQTEELFFLPNWKPPGRKQNFYPSIRRIQFNSRNYAISFQPTFFISISTFRNLEQLCGTLISCQDVSHATGFQDLVPRKADAVDHVKEECFHGLTLQHTLKIWDVGERGSGPISTLFPIKITKIWAKDGSQFLCGRIVLNKQNKGSRKRLVFRGMYAWLLYHYSHCHISFLRSS